MSFSENRQSCRSQRGSDIPKDVHDEKPPLFGDLSNAPRWPTNSPEFILSSLENALFDSAFYLDGQLCFRSDSQKLKELLSIKPDISLAGTAFCDLIATSGDRERFITSAQNLVVPSALLLEVLLGEHRLNARLYITKAGPASTELYVGVQATVSSHMGPEVPQQLAPCVFQHDQRIPSVVEAIESSIGAYAPSEAILGVSYGSNPSSPPHVSLVTVFYRSLNSDIFHLVSNLEIQEHAKTAVGWVGQLYEVQELSAIREDIVRLLPNSKQIEFLEAVERHDLESLCRLLQTTTIGNLNMISYSSGLTPSTGVQHVCASCRLILGQLRYMKKTDILAFFNKWMEGYESLKIFCSSMRAKIALSLISCAIVHRDIFESETERKRLSGIFGNLISTTDSFGITDPVRLLAVYSACMLWARFQLDLDPATRDNDPLTILEACMKDMELFGLRHPGSFAIRQLRAQALFNVASLSLHRGDMDRASACLSDLEDLGATNGSSEWGDKIQHWSQILKNNGVVVIVNKSDRSGAPSFMSSTTNL